MSKDKFPILPPEKLDREMIGQFPRMDEQVTAFLENPPASWPDWCYLPMAATYAIVSDGVADNPVLALMMGGGTNMLGKMAADIAWKYAKAIYAFDNELTQMLITQAHDDAVPVEALLHLPVPGVYIAYPPLVRDCVGLYAFWEYDYRYKIPELRLHYLQNNGEMIQIYLQFQSMDSTLHDAVSTTFNQHNLGDSEQLSQALFLNEISPDANYWSIETPGTTLYDTLWAHINMLLYLCSDEPDIIDRSEFQTKSTKAGIIIPKHAVPYEVGARIGRAISKARGDAEKENNESASSATHASPRPHVRRAHWHSFWTGKQGEERKLIIKWLPPVFVCVGKEFKIDTTIYPVKP